MVDDFNEGIPVAWAISNQEGLLAMIKILKSINNQTDPITPKWFMSDNAEQFFLHRQQYLASAVLRSCYMHGT